MLLHTKEKKMSARDDDATESTDENNSKKNADNKNDAKSILQTHFLLFLSQVNWMGMHIVFAVALRSSTKALVLSFYRELLACVLLTAYCCFGGFDVVREKKKKEKKKRGERRVV